MALTKDTTAAVISKFGANERDTGNTKVQIALLTERIKQLTEHCKTFKKDKRVQLAVLLCWSDREEVC